MRYASAKEIKNGVCLFCNYLSDIKFEQCRYKESGGQSVV